MRRALEDVGLEPERFLDRYPHQLSGGQRQRVAIAAALVLEPEGLICDEPVSMLDASVRAQILAVLLELQRRRDLALLFITHDLSLAWSLCDRIAVMYLGRVVEQGSAVDVIERPQHPYTQALVAAVPVPSASGGAEPRAPERGAARTPPTCRPGAASTRAARAASSRAIASIRRCSRTGGRGQLAACLLHDPAHDAGRSRGRRWLSAGATSRARSACSSPAPATRSPTCPGVLVGHAQAASGQRTGVTVVAPPLLPAPAGVAVDQRGGRADGQARDRRAGGDRDARVPLRDARRRHRLSGRGARLRAGDPTTS